MESADITKSHPTLMDLEGHVDDLSPRGILTAALSQHLVFRPGIKMGMRQQSLETLIFFPDAVKDSESFRCFIDSPLGTMEVNDGRWWYELVSQETLEAVETLFRNHNLNHVRNPSFYALCCPEITAAAQGLFFLNYLGEKVLLIASRKPLFTRSAKTYLTDFSSEEERLERALIGILIEHSHYNEKHNPDWDGTGHTSFEFFPSISAVDERILEKVEQEAQYSLQHRIDSRGRQYEVVIIKYKNAQNEEKVYKYPSDDSGVQSAKVYRLSYSPLRVVKEYSDGTVLVGDDELPFASYFDKKRGVLQPHIIGSCSSCSGSFQKRLREKAFDSLKNPVRGTLPPIIPVGAEELEWLFGSLLCGRLAESIGYHFDPERITVALGRKKEIPVYKTVQDSV